MARQTSHLEATVPINQTLIHSNRFFCKYWDLSIWKSWTLVLVLPILAAVQACKTFCRLAVIIDDFRIGQSNQSSSVFVDHLMSFLMCRKSFLYKSSADNKLPVTAMCNGTHW